MPAFLTTADAEQEAEFLFVRPHKTISNSSCRQPTETTAFDEFHAWKNLDPAATSWSKNVPWDCTWIESNHTVFLQLFASIRYSNEYLQP